MLLGLLLAGSSLVGATPLLVVSCGLVLLPWLPREVGSPSIQVAVTPALGIASFAALLTTASLLGVRLGSLSIALVVAGFVAAVAAASVVRPPPPRDIGPARPKHELVTLAALGCVVAFAFASSWDVAYPFQARGTDWGHYLLYADEVAVQRHVLIDDPFAGEPDRVFADPAAVGALYGSLRLVDGISSWSLTSGIVVVSALTVLSVFAAAAALWGAGPGLVAAGAYAVAPIRLDLDVMARSRDGLRAPLRAPRGPVPRAPVSRRARLAACCVSRAVPHRGDRLAHDDRDRRLCDGGYRAPRRSCRASRPQRAPYVSGDRRRLVGARRPASTRCGVGGHVRGRRRRDRPRVAAEPRAREAGELAVPRPRLARAGLRSSTTTGGRSCSSHSAPS